MSLERMRFAFPTRRSVRHLSRRRGSSAPGRRPRGSNPLGVDALENRRLLAITPGTIYDATTPATWTDADGDTVTVSVTGTAPGAGFTVELEGLATDNADAIRINLLGMTAADGLQVVVTPNALTAQPGTGFATMYSGGYTNVFEITSEAEGEYSPMTALGGIQLSAAVVNAIRLSGIDVGSISLSPGQAPYIDRINTQNNQQAADSTMYNPVTGLIDLGGITAASINALVINGAISAPTKNPYDTSVTNDFRSVIDVTGRIGSVVGLRSNLSGAIRAGSIGSVRVAAIAGEITTRESESEIPGETDLAINLPTNFKGFINSAGHLHLGFPLSDGALITGQITAGGGISGSDKSSTTDTLYLPGGYAGSLVNTSATAGIADVEIDGEALLGLFSASDIGNISADSFAGDFVVEASGSIGDVAAGVGELAGHLAAGGDIGDIRAVRAILATMIASGDIGTITSTAGNLESLSIIAGGDIGKLTLYSGMLGTSIVASGDIGTVNGLTGTLEAFLIANGGIGLSYVRAENIGSTRVVDGSFGTSSFVAGTDIGAISTFGSISGFGISDVSLVAGRDIAAILSRAHTGYGIELLKAEAGRKIAGITGISYGEFGELAGAGIIDSNFVAGAIGDVFGRGVGGTGIETTRIITRPFEIVDIEDEPGSIGTVTGLGWLDGLLEVTVVAHTSIAGISGTALVDGSGINGGSYDSHYGSIGQIAAAGGAAGGYGIVSTRFQATDLEAGGIAGLTTTASANGLDAMNDATVYARTIGPIKATVFGGLEGNGIVGGEIRAFGTADFPSYASIGAITVDVRSINGFGILDGKITASGDIGTMSVKTFNNTAISGGQFTSRGNFGNIVVEAQKGGSGIDGALFSAPGRIFFAPDANDDQDPRGNFGSITVTAGGTQATANAIANSTFTAIGEIGQVTARSKGGAGIVDSFFTADSDGDYVPPSLLGTLADGTDKGNILGVTVVASGRNLAASSGILRSEFRAANIGAVSVDVQTVEGGDGIVGSLFTARTAVYDDKGNFDNTGTIGNVTVSNASTQAGVGSGISGSSFLAGAAGAIGNIAVTTASGPGVVTSVFDASVLGRDIDQNLYTSTIGTITVNAGRVVATVLPAGILGSTFTSAAGIGNITVNSVGSGITGSVFVADFDWTLTSSVVGNIGNIAVNVPGRSASGVSVSSFFGSSIGNISVLLVDNAQQGINAVALSTFTAWSGSIGNVTVRHSMNGLPYAAGLGYAILTSTWTAAVSIGTVTIQGNTLGAVFIVGGAPPVVLAAGGPSTKVANTIGLVTFLGGTSHDLTLTAPTADGTIGGLTYLNAPAGFSLKLALTGSSMGAINLSAIGDAFVNLDLSGDSIGIFSDVTLDGSLTVTSANATRIGNLTVGKDATLNTPAFVTMGNLSVAGMLSIPGMLRNVRTVGNFSVGSLFQPIGKYFYIGSKGLRGTSIGSITIGNRVTGKGRYEFAFSDYNGPIVVAGKGVPVNKITSKAKVVNGASFVRTPGIPAPAVTTPVKKKGKR